MNLLPPFIIFLFKNIKMDRKNRYNQKRYSPFNHECVIMEILLIFGEKVKSSYKEKAIKLANECNCIIENESIKVPFKEINQNLIKLISMCSHWTTSKLYVDNKEYEISGVSTILNCSMMSRCTGICEINRTRNRYDYPSIIREFFRINGSLSNFNRYDILEDHLRLLDFLQKMDENTYNIKKEELINKIIEDSEIPFKFCSITTKDGVIRKINSLPEKIKVINEEKNGKRNFTFDISDLIETDESEKERLEKEAKIMAPIFAQEIAKELKKLMIEINESSKNKEKN